MLVLHQFYLWKSGIFYLQTRQFWIVLYSNNQLFKVISWNKDYFLLQIYLFFTLLLSFLFIIEQGEMQDSKIKNIIKLCKKGDINAKKSLYEMFSARMMSLCFRYLGNRQDAEDALIGGFIAVYENINKLKTNNLEGWIYRIMINSCIALIKKGNKIVCKDDETFFENFIDTEIDTPQRFSKADLFGALQSLSNSQRMIFNMSVIDNYSHDEICKILNIKYNSLKSILYQTKIRLKDYLIDLEEKRKENNENRRDF